MPVPKKKVSKTRTRRRHTVYVKGQQRKLSEGVVLVDCSQCGSKRRAHHVCSECGYYKGKQVVDKSKQVDKITKISA